MLATCERARLASVCSLPGGQQDTINPILFAPHPNRPAGKRLQEERAKAREEEAFIEAANLLTTEGPGSLSHAQVAILTFGWTQPVYTQRAREATERLARQAREPRRPY